MMQRLSLSVPERHRTSLNWQQQNQQLQQPPFCLYGLPVNLGQNCHTSTGHVICLSDTADNDIDHCSEAGENSAGIVLKDTLQINAPKKRKATAKTESSDKQKRKISPEETQVAEVPEMEVNEHGDKDMKKENVTETVAPYSDYIHVRARRGQATDSHSLAERVRREKISDRMKHLQDLVPGCNNIAGKASMLDEIINYVQSLQKQVEFLSMKLAAVDPLTDCNIHSFMKKINSLEPLNLPYPNITMDFPELNPLQHAIDTPVSVSDATLDSYFDVSGSSVWEQNLQELYKIDCVEAQGREISFPSQLFHDEHTLL